ncbi:MAG: 2-C-methyl-D-erythritol 4-phosphate cytidylyltransferase [Candidatus Aminicenantes bacterium]|nr:MAG: 2-C-methyl-D-erythritol 4-phosphate cytidylyltransferase [Candidatus Aminicenantes bacterium]
MKTTSAIAIIVAAGEGRRFGFSKQFALLKEKPVLDWCLDKFESHEKIKEIVLVLKDDAQKEVFSNRYRKIVAVVKGGDKRQDSVLAGFSQIDPDKAEVVLIHDGVRPLVESDLISRVINETIEQGAVVPVIPVEDTIKLIEGNQVNHTLDRASLFRAQTPQGFSYSVLKEALDNARDAGFYGTDEAALVERIGKNVSVVQGDPRNIKITTPLDLRLAEALLED